MPNHKTEWYIEKGMDFKPPQYIIDTAKQAKEWIQSGFAGDGMVDSTKEWVNKVVAGDSFTAKKIQEANAWLARHESDTKGDELDKSNPTPGWVAKYAWFEDGSGNATKYFSSMLDTIEKLDIEFKTKMIGLSHTFDTDLEKLPSEFILFKFGENRTSKGSVFLTEDSALKCISMWEDQGNDLSIDYEHQAVSNKSNGPIPASGWFKLSLKSDGIYAVNVEWTETAKELLLNREYRYYSPAFYVNTDDQVVEILNCALTNIPAIKDLKPLIASQKTLEGVDGMTQEEMKVLLDEYFMKLPDMVKTVVDECLSGMKSSDEVVNDEESVSEPTVEVELENMDEKDVEIEKLTSKINELEEQAWTVALMSHGADITNSKRFSDLKTLSKLHKKEDQSILDAVNSFVSENQDLFSKTVEMSKSSKSSKDLTLSKPKPVVKLSKFEEWGKVSHSNSKFIGGK